MPQPHFSAQEQYRLTMSYASGLLSAHLVLCSNCQEWVRKYHSGQVSAPNVAIYSIAWCLLDDRGLASKSQVVPFQDIADMVRKRV